MSAELFAKFIKADLVVYATPLYHFTLNAQMKAFIERTLPILEPFLIKKEDGQNQPSASLPVPGSGLAVRGRVPGDVGVRSAVPIRQFYI